MGHIQRLKLVFWLALAMIFFLGVRPAAALIDVLTPLSKLLSDSEVIFVAKVEKVDGEKPAAVLVVTQTLKGKPLWERLPINLAGDKEKHTPMLLKRIAADVPVVVFALKQEPGEYSLLAFTNGTWFQVQGRADGDETRFAFTHGEPYLRRTFKGTTDELVQVTTESLAGKRKAPAPLTKEPPGFGPELDSKK